MDGQLVPQLPGKWVKGRYHFDLVYHGEGPLDGLYVTIIYDRDFISDLKKTSPCTSRKRKAVFNPAEVQARTQATFLNLVLPDIPTDFYKDIPPDLPRLDVLVYIATELVKSGLDERIRELKEELYS